MHDGPDDGAPRSRRTRTDDVLDRYGLRDGSTARDDEPVRRPDADEPAPWPPRSRRRGDGRPPPDGPAPDGSGADRTDALPSVAEPASPGRPGRRHRGATDSRHTQVMPVTPRRRAKQDEPEPPADVPPAAPPLQAAGPPGPPETPRTPRPPSQATAPPDTGTSPAAPNAVPSNGVIPPGLPPAAPNGVPSNGVSPSGPRASTAPPAPVSPPATGRSAPEAAPPGEPPRATTPGTTPSRSPQPGRVPSDPPTSASPTPNAGHGAGRPAAAAATDAPAAPGDAVEDTAAPDATPDDGRRSRTGRPGRGRRRQATRRAAPPGDTPPPAGPGRRLLRIAGALIAVVVFAACASGFASHQTLENAIRTVPALDSESDAISSRAVQAADENILVLGLPADRAGVPESARTDTAVLVHQPADGAAAVTLGFPPTLEVARPPCRRWDPATGTYGATVPAESRTAFSAAYDVGGPKCTVDVVQQVTGLAVTRFVAFDLAGVNPLVGAVGGVGVCAERPVVDPALGPVVTRPGDTVLGGAEAARFAAATGVDDVSPVDRVRRQQRVLSSALDSALSTTSLLTPGAADRVARALPGALTVDAAGTGELLTLAGSLSRTTGGDAAPPYVSLPVNEQPNTRGHLELNRSDSSDLFSALQKHEPLPPEFTVPAQRAGSLLLPQGTVVDVLNAAGRSGLADDIAAALRAQGYAIGAVSDAPPTPDTTIRFSPDRAEASGVLGASVPGARPEADPGSTGSLKLVLGSSFPGASAISAPTPKPPADCG